MNAPRFSNEYEPRSPKPAERLIIENARREGRKNNRIALEVQLGIREMFADPSVSFSSEANNELHRFRQMAYEGYHPKFEEMANLQNLQNEEGRAAKAIGEFAERLMHIYSDQERKFEGWEDIPEQAQESKDLQAVTELVKRISRERVLIFGSARKHEGSPEYDQTRFLGQVFVDALNESVITGGGPGIMEAANRGAMEGAIKKWNRLQQLLHDESVDPAEVLNQLQAFRTRFHSLGIGIIVPHEQGWNDYMEFYLSIKRFAPRKIGLVSGATGRSVECTTEKNGVGMNGNKPAIIVQHGGFGTMDELWEVATLEQCRKMDKVPIFVLGKMGEIVNHVGSVLREMGTIKEDDLDLFHICEDGIQLIERYHEHYDLDINPLAAQAIDSRRKLLGIDGKKYFSQ